MSDLYEGGGEKERDAQRKRDKRAAAKDVLIPPCADRERRERLEADDEAWLRYYFHELFTYEFTSQQRVMIDAIRKAMLYGGDQAIAASRGEGKTKICEAQLLKYTISGVISFAIFFAATTDKAVDSVTALREAIETNERLRADYPEVCIPVVALENTPNRAHYQTVTGHRHDNGKPYERVPSKFSWCGDEIVFPNVPGSPCAKARIATRGLDCEVRGVNKGGKRPQVACIDDPDTEQTVRSEEQRKKLMERIDRGIAGLGGQRRAIARVMLTTLQRLDSASAIYTDPKKKPSWKGKRFRYLIHKPERMDLWEEYVSRWQKDKRRVDEDGDNIDPHSRGAHAFLLAHYEEMHDGAVVANKNRFDPTILEDGSQLEVSALQSYFNFVAKNGQAAASAELDNDPPEETAAVSSAINAHRVQRQVSGYERGIVPPGCTVLVQGIDVGKKALHWVVRAYRPDATVYTIDYAVYEVTGTVYGSDEGLDQAIRRAILGRMEQMKEAAYCTPEGEVVPIALTLVDSGYRSTAVYAACREAGLGARPIKGCGRSNGTAQLTYPNYTRRGPHAKPGGDGWCEARDNPKMPWLVLANVDYWKAWEHDRWMTDPALPGSSMLFGEPGTEHRDSPDQKGHFSYAHHIDAEKEVEEVIKGMLKRFWKPTPGRGQNHYLDASVYADVAANMLGIRIASATPAPAKKERVPLGQLGKKAA